MVKTHFKLLCYLVFWLCCWMLGFNNFYDFYIFIFFHFMSHHGQAPWKSDTEIFQKIKICFHQLKQAPSKILDNLYNG